MNFIYVEVLITALLLDPAFVFALVVALAVVALVADHFDFQFVDRFVNLSAILEALATIIMSTAPKQDFDLTIETYMLYSSLVADINDVSLPLNHRILCA